MFKVLCVALSAALAATTAFPVGACETTLVLQSSKPTLTAGTIVFQAGTQASNAALYLFDTVSHNETNVSEAWTQIYSPINAHFSPNRQYLVFTAVTCPKVATRKPACVNANSARTDAFIWQVGASGVVGLTTALPNRRYEDVNFSSDGSFVVLKQAGVLAAYHLDYSNPSAPVLGKKISLPAAPAGQASGPYPTADGDGLYFWLNTGEAAVVYYLAYAGGPAQEVDAPGTTSQYFPVPTPSGSVYLVAHDGHESSGNMLVDQIYMAPARGEAFTSVPTNACTSDNSDPAAMGTNLLLFSNHASGTYRPFLADLSTNKIWSLTPRTGLGAKEKNVLGISFTTMRYTL